MPTRDLASLARKNKREARMAEAHHAVVQGQKLAAAEQDPQGEPWVLR